VLEVARHPHIGDGHETQARVSQPLLETLSQDDADAVRQTGLSFSSHFLLLL
jgi:hypothetical protein